MASSRSTHAEQHKISTVVVSRPGIMQQSLRAALTACPAISVAASSGDGLSGLNQVVLHRPALLVIDSNLLKEEVEALLGAVKSSLPGTYCLILIQSPQRAAWALTSGADEALVRDSSTQQLQIALQRLAQNDVNHEG